MAERSAVLVFFAEVLSEAFFESELLEDFSYTAAVSSNVLVNLLAAAESFLAVVVLFAATTVEATFEIDVKLII